MDGLEIVRGLMARGYFPHHAAALAGHMLQESGGNPTAVNPEEGANGLLQWRGSRWDDLQSFAREQGKSPNDPQIQMDFIGRELNGSEKRAGAAFLSTPDVASASTALKPFIRFGDDSAGTRLANANGLFAQLGGSAPVGALAGTAAPANSLGGVAMDAAPVGALATAPPTMAQGLGALGKTLAGPEVQFDPVRPLQVPQANIGQSQQIAAALARAYGA